MTIQKMTLGLLSLFMMTFFLGCGGGESSGDETPTGTLNVSLTDAPIVDDANVTGVFITVAQIQYHTSGGWSTLSDFNTSLNPINLLDLQEGTALSLATNTLPAGKYTQLRFLLEAAEESQAPKSNTGCFIQFDGDRNETLYVPSGSQSGYKTIGNFEVPVNGSVSITADFDVRKSIVVSAEQSIYKLKPTIRVIVDAQAGEIKGSVSNLNSDNTYVVYAYEIEDNVDVASEAANDFINAISSTNINDNGSYTLAFLSEGFYDLLIVEYDINGDYVGHNIQISLKVLPEKTMQHDFAF